MTNLNCNFLLKEIPKVLKANDLKYGHLIKDKHPELKEHISFVIRPPYPGYPVTVLIGEGYCWEGDGDYYISMYDKVMFSHESHDRMSKGSREILQDLNLMCQDLLHFSVNQREVLHHA